MWWVDLGDPVHSVWVQRAESLRAAFERREVLRDDVARDGVELWAKYVSASPLAFDEARRRGSSTYPELERCAEAHGAWFPWQRDGALRLSDADQRLLDCVGDDWSPFLKGASAVGLSKALIDMFLPWFGDAIISDRLDEWEKAGAIERQDPQDGKWTMSSVLRLTSHGRRLRDEGARQIAELPTIYTGGCCINDPAQPWVRVGDENGWRLSRGA